LDQLILRKDGEQDIIINLIRYCKICESTKILFWGNINRIEDIKQVKKIIFWNPVRVSTKRPPKNRGGDEVRNDLKKL
jgi:hypothetical protein